MELKDGIKTFHAKSGKEWRKWLEKNHQSEKSVWLIIYKKESKVKSVYYPEAVEEALCFGWIDSKANKRDEESHYQFFSKRNPKSNWSKSNKARVERLLILNLIAPAGLETIEIAKKNGAWSALDEVDNISVPADMQQAFIENSKALENWEKFSPSVKRAILTWILNAKKPETRKNRIDETIKLAAENIKANQ